MMIKSEDYEFKITEKGLDNLNKHLKHNRWTRNKNRWRDKGVRKKEVKKNEM